METPLTTGFAQIFSYRSKDLSCPKFGGAAASFQFAYSVMPQESTISLANTERTKLMNFCMTHFVLFCSLFFISSP